MMLNDVINYFKNNNLFISRSDSFIIFTIKEFEDIRYFGGVKYEMYVGAQGINYFENKVKIINPLALTDMFDQINFLEFFKNCPKEVQIEMLLNIDIFTARKFDYQ